MQELNMQMRNMLYLKVTFLVQGHFFLCIKIIKFGIYLFAVPGI